MSCNGALYSANRISVLSGGGTSHLDDDNFRILLNYASIMLFQPLPAYYAKSICSILCCVPSLSSIHVHVAKVGLNEMYF